MNFGSFKGYKEEKLLLGVKCEGVFFDIIYLINRVYEDFVFCSM